MPVKVYITWLFPFSFFFFFFTIHLQYLIYSPLCSLPSSQTGQAYSELKIFALITSAWNTHTPDRSSSAPWGIKLGLLSKDSPGKGSEFSKLSLLCLISWPCASLCSLGSSLMDSALSSVQSCLPLGSFVQTDYPNFWTVPLFLCYFYQLLVKRRLPQTTWKMAFLSQSLERLFLTHCPGRYHSPRWG